MICYEILYYMQSACTIWNDMKWYNMVCAKARGETVEATSETKKHEIEVFVKKNAKIR